MYEMGVVELPVNNALTRMAPTSINSAKTWTRPLEGSFKYNFNVVAKGNPGLAGFEGAIRNLDGIILSMLWGSIGNNTNNMVGLEGLINGLSWNLQMGKTPLVVEGDSQIIINMA